MRSTFFRAIGLAAVASVLVSAISIAALAPSNPASGGNAGTAKIGQWTLYTSIPQGQTLKSLAAPAGTGNTRTIAKTASTKPAATAVAKKPASAATKPASASTKPASASKKMAMAKSDDKSGKADRDDKVAAGSKKPMVMANGKKHRAVIAKGRRHHARRLDRDDKGFRATTAKKSSARKLDRDDKGYVAPKSAGSAKKAAITSKKPATNSKKNATMSKKAVTNSKSASGTAKKPAGTNAVPKNMAYPAPTSGYHFQPGVAISNLVYTPSAGPVVTNARTHWSLRSRSRFFTDEGGFFFGRHRDRYEGRDEGYSRYERSRASDEWTEPSEYWGNGDQYMNDTYENSI